MKDGEHIEIVCSESISIYDENDDRTQEYLYDRAIEGNIYACNDDDEIVGEIGKLWLYAFDGNAAYLANDDISEWCEEYSPDMHVYVKPLYKKGLLKPEYRCNKGNSVLVFHWLEIYPEYRSCGYGEQIVKSILNRYSQNYGAVVVMPHPLQYSVQAEESKKRSPWMKKMKFKDFNGIDEKTAYKKVSGFWKRMGFLKIPRTEIYYYRRGV